MADTTPNDPLGLALQDFLRNGLTADLQLIVPSTNDVWTQDVSEFFAREPANDVEHAVLAAARGKVLDIGAGAGRASLLLQSRGHEVLAIDISPGAVDVMRSRGVLRAEHTGWETQLQTATERFDTVLLFNRGFGLAASPDGLRTFLRLLRRVVADGGQVVGDWREPHRDPSRPEAADRNPYLQREMRVRYGAIEGTPFQWLEAPFDELQRVAEAEGWHARCLLRGDDGYAVVMTPRD